MFAKQPNPNAGKILIALTTVVESRDCLTLANLSDQATLTGRLHKSKPKRCNGVAPICVNIGTVSCVNTICACGLAAKLSGTEALSQGARPKDPAIVIASLIKNVPVADTGTLTFGTGGVTAAFDAKVLEAGDPKICAYFTSFQTPRGTLTRKVVPKTMLPV